MLIVLQFKKRKLQWQTHVVHRVGLQERVHICTRGVTKERVFERRPKGWITIFNETNLGREFQVEDTTCTEGSAA